MPSRWVVKSLGGTAAVLVAAGLTGAVLVNHHSRPQEGGRGRAVAAVAPLPAKPKPAPTPTGPASTLIVTLAAATTYSNTPGGPAAGSLPAANPFGAPEVLAILGHPDSAGWAQAELPIRPDGTTGWINTTGLHLSQTTYHLTVNLAAHTLSVYSGTHLLLTTPCAVGKPTTPTPAAHTYLWELIRPNDPEGAYGPYIFGLALFSNAYSVFNGGDAQIGIHGQDEPWSVGEAASHGCVRLANNMITELAGMLPLGTPVTIS